MAAKKHFHLPSLKLKKFDNQLYLHRIVGKEMAVVYAEFQKGGKHDNITHSNEEFFYVLKGHFKAYIGKKKFVLKKGDGLLIPSNEIHGFTVLQNSLALITFAPPINHTQADKIKATMKKR